MLFSKPNVKPVETPNKQKRLKRVKNVVIHHTANASLDAVLTWFKNPKSQVSAHYVIDKNGEIYELADPSTEVCWHCRGHNQDSIGIECVSKAEPLTDRQRDALYDLLCHLLSHYDLDHTAVKGHREMGNNTLCPGNLFYQQQASTWARVNLGRLFPVKDVS